ncbi:hypothetical protein AAZX31_18G222600 [Glycine max]
MERTTYESGYEKLKKKQKVEKLIESQRGALDKFVIIHKNDAEASSIGENVIEQPLINHTDNEKNIIEQPPIDNTDNDVEQPPINNTDNTNSHNFNQELEDNILEIGVEGNVERNNTSSEVPTNIYDPGLWKNIDGKFRDLMIENGPIRHDNFQYPKDENNRYFYSSYLDKVYCFCCKLFGSTNVSQLANERTKDWKNLEKEHWEKVLLRIIAIVKYLSKNNLAFRGTNEKIYEKGNGNFLSLIEMIAEFDPIMQEHVRRIKSNETHNHFLSNTIQNKLIEMIVFQVKKSIIEKVKDAKYFSVILDCAPDVTHQEQMTLILRCIDTSKSPIKIEEYFLEFLKLVNVLKKYGFNIDDIRGQGVQRRLLDVNPRAFYTSCGYHNLNLVLCDMAILQHIYSLFASSTKRWKILQDNVSKFSIKSLSQTSWKSRIESVKAIKFQAPKVRDALTELSKNYEDPKLKSETMSLATHELEDFEFLLGMNICKILQSKDMHIDVVIDHLKGLITYLKHYRKNGFALSLESTEKMAIEMDIELKFREKRKIHRKSHFDENISNEITHSPEESFPLDEDELKKYCINLEKFLRFNEYFDIDDLDLFSELKVLREVLREEISTPIEVLIVTAERSFSKLKLLKSYLKSTMLQDRLNVLAILSIESEVLELLDYKTLINDFAAKKARKLI